MPWFVWVALAVWLAGWIGFIIAEEPSDAADGTFVFFFGFLFWPLFAVGWMISRPWA